MMNTFTSYLVFSYTQAVPIQVTITVTSKTETIQRVDGLSLTIKLSKSLTF